MGRPKYTLLMKVPLGVVGFFDGLWNEDQIACSASIMKEQMELVSGPWSAIIRFFDFDPQNVVANVNTSTGHVEQRKHPDQY